MQETVHDLRSSAHRPSAATLTVWCATLFLLCVLVLHVLRRDVDPSSRMLSEYALGRGGWIMAVAFFSLSITFATLLVALRRHLSGAWGMLGMLALAAASVGSAMGGVFPMDPPLTPPEQYSLNGKLHGVAFMLGGSGVLLAALFISLALWRNEAWRGMRQRLTWSAAAIWAVHIVLIVALVKLMSGDSSAEHGLGWLNRALVASWLFWAVTLAGASRDAAVRTHR
jgi:Protein of unknown function (DUF998)